MFVKDNPILLSSSAEVLPKHRLGAEYVPDFVLDYGGGAHPGRVKASLKDDPAALLTAETPAQGNSAGGQPWEANHSVAGGMVAWQDTTPLPPGQGYFGKIFLYNDATGQVIKLAESVGIGRPLVSEGRVLFIQTIGEITSALWLAERDDAPPYDQ